MSIVNNQAEISNNPFVEGFFHSPKKPQDNEASQCDKICYVAGRSVRFIYNIPGAIIDIALQIIQSVVFCVGFGLNLAEKIIMQKNSLDDCSIGPFFTQLIYSIRIPFINSLDYLAQDVGLIEEVELNTDCNDHRRKFDILPSLINTLYNLVEED